jgi:hypothetical protein
MEVEDKVEFADVAEVLVEYFHEALHQFEHDELVLVLVNNCYEVETGISFVDDLVLLVVEKIAHFGVAGDHQLVDLHISYITSFKILCFSVWFKFDEYHFVNRDRPWRLIRKKQ